MSDSSFISYHRPSLDEDEIAEVVDTLRSGWLTSGPKTRLFEQRFAEYVQAPHALAVNSCTAGLHLAMVALGIGPGDEVITTPNTFCATVNTILHTGATPVLADIGPDGNIDPKSIEERITPRTRAILPVHWSGLACDMDAIWNLAARYGLKVIEDAAHAAGTYYRGIPIGGGNPSVGRYSDAVAYSFYATKNLTTGEGGMVTSHSAELMDRMKILCLHGIDKTAWNRYSEAGKWRYDVMAHGFKYNLSDILSSIGLHQLRKLEDFTARRAHLAARYNRAFSSLDEVETPFEPGGQRHCWHLYVLRLRLETLSIDRAEFIEQLRVRKVGTSVHFIPVPLHPAFADLAARPENACPKALAFYPRLVSLPLYPAMTEEEVDYIAAAVKEVVALHRVAAPAAVGGEVAGKV